MAEHFLSCDWGTSSFRLKLIAIPGLQVISEENSKQGIAVTYSEWEKTGDIDPNKRASFYLDVILAHLLKLESKLDISLDNIPVVLSGMASSTIGIRDIPYTHTPFATDGKDINTYLIKATKDFAHDVLIISGARSEDDVMRGEETQLIGCIDEEDVNLQAEKVFIFPGTHSKHISVKEGKVLSFTTYMTGEFFALLSNNSILHLAVEKHDDNGQPSDSFTKGVVKGAEGNLLHASFMVRTNNLFAKLTKEQNYDYLSGLLIGTELKDLLHLPAEIYLCCNTNLEKYYLAALAALGFNNKIKVIPSEKVDAAAVKGQFKIFKNKGLYHG